MNMSVETVTFTTEFETSVPVNLSTLIEIIRNTDTTMSTNSTMPTGPGPPQQEQNNTSFAQVLEALAAFAMWLICIFGNILVVTVVQRSRRLQSTTNYFVISLAIIDLVMAVFCMPFMIGRVIADEWVFGSFICKFVRFLQYMKPGATVYVLIAISVDRFYTILYPLSFKITRTKAKKMILVSWFVATLISCPAFYFFFEENQNNTGTICRGYVSSDAAGIMYTTAILLTEYLLPLVVLLIAYVRIFRHICSVGVGGRVLQSTMNTVPRAKVKTVKMLVIVSIVFFVSWAPFYFAQEWFVCFPELSNDRTGEIIYYTSVWITLTSSAFNPIIYSCYNPNFRRGCKEVFCISTMKCYRKDTYAITSVSKFARKNHVGVINDHLEGARSFTTYRAFDRDANGDKKMAWPLPTNSSTTYL